MNEEVMKQLEENFPIMKKIKDNIEIFVNHKNELMLCTDETNYTLTQQDCLELSQLFALLATAFEEG